MNEVMTLKEIEEIFISEWVLVADPELTPQFEVVRGKVVYHCADRDELYRKIGELGLERSAILYTGSVPEDLVLML
ncbi:MAG: hypothetical protein OXR67_07410 [Chloroflexota bacterium]|nr:hypothetical protein [Chloroflexota bacterium]